MSTILAIAFFVFGLAFGSFLNVCISRIPNDLSIVAPRSYCPKCHTPVSWRDNIPVISWLVLGGHCRACREPISLRYPAVELLTALLFLACYASFGLSGITVKSCLFCFLITGLIFMDAETGLLPAEFTYPGIALGLLFAWLVPLDTGGTHFMMWFSDQPVRPAAHVESLVEAVLAAIIGAAFFYLAWAAHYLIRKRDGLGFGDIALMAMLGAFLGLKLTVVVIFLAPVSATIYVIAMLIIHPRRKSPNGLGEPILAQSIPFGVFLGASALVVLFAGDAIWRWYRGFFY